MWLPETAVDDETLDVLAAEGIGFTILAPHQVARVPAAGRPGWHRTAAGRRIALFLYDGALSHDVAFGPLVRDPAAWIERLTARAGGNGGSADMPEVVAIATDGETFGHHHREGAVTLARVLDALSRRGDVRVDNFAAFLARHPPQEDVQLVAPSAWSCPHGVERWRSDCGCFAPDPWAARDAYGAVLGAPDDAVARFLGERLRQPDDPSARARAHQLLELERHALRMFTSCGWFFDDIAGLESLIVLRSAARAIELAGSDAVRLEAGLLERLALAPSNDPAVGSGRELYMKGVKAVPSRGVPT